MFGDIVESSERAAGSWLQIIDLAVTSSSNRSKASMCWAEAILPS